MQVCSVEDWRNWQHEGCTLLPVCATRAVRNLPDTWLKGTEASPFALLESAQSGRYTYICRRSARIVIGETDHARIYSGDGLKELETRFDPPLAILDALRKERRVPRLRDAPAMCGGFVALFGYDLVRTWERLPAVARRDLPLPLYAAIETREWLVFDRDLGSLDAIVWTEVDSDDAARLAELHCAAERAAADALSEATAERASGPRAANPARLQTKASSNEPFTGEAFKAAAKRIHDYIAAGDTYQVNLSRRMGRPTGRQAEEIYTALRRVNPSPYMGLFKLPAFALVCGSPELLVKLEGDVISSRPIAGTRPRGEVAAEDSHFSAELFASEKERAEHLMLVDLIRNDIGRVAAYGSVVVPEFMVLERYSHVMHIVSQVEGRLAAEKTWVDVFRSMFPGGTITGCPKIRTMEIIEELEPTGRGFYTGSLGWISYAGDMEMNIIIRSLLLLDGVAHVQAGAGVVADSDPARELDESTRKAQALWVALDQAEAQAPHHHD